VVQNSSLSTQGWIMRTTKNACPTWGTTTIPSFLGHKVVSRFFCIVQKIERYFGTKPYGNKISDIRGFVGIFCTNKLVHEINVPNL
jgi:hypothetical protein